MRSKPSRPGKPGRLLLATNLGANCDRAHERTAQLGEEWQCELIALNVLDDDISPALALAWGLHTTGNDMLAMAGRQLAREVARLGSRATAQIARSADASAVIRDVAVDSNCDLVVTGISRNDFFAGVLLGTTVERLARRLPQPLLVVRQRVHGPYRNILVAVDFSEASRHALLRTAGLFPGRELTVFHASEVALAGILDQRVDVAGRDGKHDEWSRFLAAADFGADAQVRPFLVDGALEPTLARHVLDNEVDLVVMGATGRSGLASVLLGSTAARLLQWLPCDALVVREPPAVARSVPTEQPAD